MCATLFLLIVTCPPLVEPANGTVNCSLGDDGILSYEDTCSYTCTTGYQVSGSNKRMCLFDGSWSGDNEVSCSQTGT